MDKHRQTEGPLASAKQDITRNPRSVLFDEYGSIPRILIRPITRQGGIAGLFRYIRGLGFRETLRRTIGLVRQPIGAAIDRLYDRRHNVQTSGLILREHLDVSGINQELSEAYAPTPTRSFRFMLDAVDIDYKDYTFIDYGSGKGRMLLIAAEKPFRRIIGVEHSQKLNQIAENNIRADVGSDRKCDHIEPVCIDARYFNLPDEPSLLYLFSPFSGEVMVDVFHRIAKSYNRNPRPLVIIFSEEVGAGEIPTELILGIGSMNLLETPPLPFDPGAPVPLFYAVFASDEAMQAN